MATDERKPGYFGLVFHGAGGGGAGESDDDLMFAVALAYRAAGGSWGIRKTW
jgi:hypothetical protein